MKPRKRTSIIWTIEKEHLDRIVKESVSMSDVLRKLGKDPTTSGAQHKVIQERLKSEGIDYSHFALHMKSRAYYLGKSHIKYKDISDLSLLPRHSLRVYVLKNNIIPYVCKECGLGELWNTKKLTLQLDHIDGNYKNNKLENLRFLCPNCHSQTDTYGRKNGLKNKETKKCSKCSVTIKYSKSGFCKKCVVQKTKA